MKKDTRAVAILITLTVLGAVIAVGLGIAVIVARELSITKFVDDSAVAVMAADAGLERRLYEIRRLGWQQNQYDDQYGPVQLSNGASYEICPQGAQCRGKK